MDTHATQTQYAEMEFETAAKNATMGIELAGTDVANTARLTVAGRANLKGKLASILYAEMGPRTKARTAMTGTM